MGFSHRYVIIYIHISRCCKESSFGRKGVWLWKSVEKSEHGGLIWVIRSSIWGASFGGNY